MRTYKPYLETVSYVDRATFDEIAAITFLDVWLDGFPQARLSRKNEEWLLLHWPRFRRMGLI